MKRITIRDLAHKWGQWPQTIYRRCRLLGIDTAGSAVSADDARRLKPPKRGRPRK